MSCTFTTSADTGLVYIKAGTKILIDISINKLSTSLCHGLSSHGVTALNGFYGGEGAVAGKGAAIGYNAKAINNSVPIDAIQLGTGTNETPNTLQVYSYPLLDNNGYIVEDRLKSTGVTPVQSDWNVADDTLLSYINNKPTKLSSFANDSGFITIEDVNSNSPWYYDEDSDYIKNIESNFAGLWISENTINEDDAYTAIYDGKLVLQKSLTESGNLGGVLQITNLNPLDANIELLYLGDGQESSGYKLLYIQQPNGTLFSVDRYGNLFSNKVQLKGLDTPVPTAGQIVYDSTNNQIKYHDGNDVKILGGSSSTLTAHEYNYTNTSSSVIFDDMELLSLTLDQKYIINGFMYDGTYTYMMHYIYKSSVTEYYIKGTNMNTNATKVMAILNDISPVYNFIHFTIFK